MKTTKQNKRSKVRTNVEKKKKDTSLSDQLVLIQMIHNGGGLFGSYPKPDTLDT